MKFHTKFLSYCKSSRNSFLDKLQQQKPRKLVHLNPSQSTTRNNHTAKYWKHNLHHQSTILLMDCNSVFYCNLTSTNQDSIFKIPNSSQRNYRNFVTFSHVPGKAYLEISFELLLFTSLTKLYLKKSKVFDLHVSIISLWPILACTQHN